MSEHLLWYAPLPANSEAVSAVSSIAEEGAAGAGGLWFDQTIEITISTSLEELRMRLEQGEPAMLVAEPGRVRGWAGWELIYASREKGLTLPVVILAERESPETAVQVFEAGGNDYMELPPYPAELRCRIRNLLSLTGRRRLGNGLLKIDGLLMEPTRRYISRDGAEMKLTPKEFDLLHYLASNAGEICSREELLSQVWGYRFPADTNVVDVYIRHLRMKLDKGYRNKLIHTVRGVGYVLKAPKAAPPAEPDSRT